MDKRDDLGLVVVESVEESFVLEEDSSEAVACSFSFLLSSSSRLTADEVEVVPCKEDVLARGGLAGDLVRMAR